MHAYARVHTRTRVRAGVNIGTGRENGDADRNDRRQEPVTSPACACKRDAYDQDAPAVSRCQCCVHVHV